ncbi:hypothetical protein CAPTEDRAFT_220634 [Capitella teleta]|uniref:Semaphorin-2A n=1 Tax=Capitella teleta TaxID=283909 RepID=R7T7G7_CAPTE|nr:hypothetical protein CAPTEDRAFT_220634 [Capitella teleta]|eukprot:ELT89363.1 hypothetical protein CAPTEDRAFT_220634 [Capitella teleta]
MSVGSIAFINGMIDALYCFPGVNRFPSEYTSTPQYFRKMALHGDHLYVGAMDLLIKFSLVNISNATARVEQNVTEIHSFIKTNLIENVEKCLKRNRHAPDFDCRNHIRGIYIDGEDVYLCGTGSYQPQDFFLNRRDLTLNDSALEKMSKNSGLAKCPFDPHQDSTLIYVREGNPDDIPTTYSATSLDDTVESSLIYRPMLQSDSKSYQLLRTIHLEKKWLNVPHFIASFDIEDYVYFFFREISVEHPYEDEVTYSRVARVCKNDRGGDTALKNSWTTFLKARINCSLPGDNPLYFNFIQDVVYSKNDSAFYAVFTMTMGNTRSSAVCRMNLSDIEQFFRVEHFQEQLDVTKLWQKVPQNKVPTPRPGECNPDSEHRLSSVIQQFIRSRPLMYESIQAKPLYDFTDATFVRLAVQRVQNPEQTNLYRVFYLADDKGFIQKVSYWNEGAVAHSRLLQVWSPFSAPHLVRQMIVHNNELFASTDYEVIQLDVKRCMHYTKCTSCSVDPHCKWNKNIAVEHCQTYPEGSVQNVEAASSLATCSAADACQRPIETHEVQIEGFSVKMSCNSHCDPTTSVQWFHNNELISIDADKYILGTDNSLVVMETTNTDAGSYECKNESVLLQKHFIVMADCGDGEEAIECVWKNEFLKWCKEFNDYQTRMNEWQDLKDNCTKDVDEKHCYIQN